MSAHPLSDVFSEVVALSWRGGWLIVFLATLRVVVRGRIPAQVWFVAWIVVALRLIVPFSVPVGWSPYNFTAITPISTAPAVPVSQAVRESVAAVPMLNPVVPLESSSLRAPDGGNRAEMISTIWLLGVIIFLLVRGVVSWRFRAGLRRAAVADVRVCTIARHEANLCGLGARVTCVETHGVDAPALFGVRHPRLLFPPGFARQLSDDELRLVVRHELAHWRRRDLLVHALMQIAVALHWFNPLAWLAGRLARADCELACDEFVLRRESEGMVSAYGSTLLKVLGMMRGRRRSGSVVAMLEGRQQLAYRVRMIAGYRASTLGRLMGGILLVGLVAAASFTRESRAADRPPIPASTAATTVVPERSAAELPDAAREKFPPQARAAEYLQSMVEPQRRRVDELAERLQAYRQSKGLVSLDQRANIVNESLSAINLEVRRANIVVQAAEIRLNQIREAREKGGDLTGLSFIAESSLVAQLLEKQSAQRIAVAKLHERYRAQHPDMVSARNALEAIEIELRRAIDSVCQRVVAEHSAAVFAVDQRQQELDRLRQEALEFDRVAVEYRNLEREFRTQDQILRAIAERAQEVTVGVDATARPLSVVFERKPSGWVLTEARGDQRELAKADAEIQALKSKLDVLAVPEVSVPKFVTVLGAINRPGRVELPADGKLTLVNVLTLAGGPSRFADMKKVSVTRRNPETTETTVEIVDMEPFLKRGARPWLVEPGDSVLVPQRTQ